MRGNLARLLVAGLVGASLKACAAAPGGVIVHERVSAVVTASGQPIRLPTGEVRIVLSEYAIPAGTALPVHRHPHQRLVIVREGTLVVTNVETGEAERYGAGDLIVEAVDQPHFGVNAGSSTVRLWVLDALPVGVKSNTVLR